MYAKGRYGNKVGGARGYESECWHAKQKARNGHILMAKREDEVEINRGISEG